MEKLNFTKTDLISMFNKKCLKSIEEKDFKNAFSNDDMVKNFNNAGFTLKILNDNSPASVILIYSKYKDEEYFFHYI